jgi:hypothetical protein
LDNFCAASFDLTRFLHPNRYPPRIKSRAGPGPSRGRLSFENAMKQKGRPKAGLSVDLETDADQYFATTGLAQLKR